MSILTTVSSLGPQQIVHVYEHPLRRADVQSTLQRHAADIAADEQRFAEHIFIPNWRETLLVLDPAAQINPRHLLFATATSYHIQAVRKGAAQDVTPVSVIAVLVTADDKFVLGVRRGRMAGGQIHVSPAGYASLKHKEDPLFGSLLEELREELGIPADAATELLLLGHETDPNTKGIDFILLLRTKWSAEEISTVHRQAFAVYESAIKSGAEELEARKQIGNAGLPNIDAWEHSELLFIENKERLLKQIIEQRAVTHQGVEIPLVDACRGALMAYLAYLQTQ